MLGRIDFQREIIHAEQLGFDTLDIIPRHCFKMSMTGNNQLHDSPYRTAHLVTLNFEAAVRPDAFEVLHERGRSANLSRYWNASPRSPVFTNHLQPMRLTLYLAQLTTSVVIVPNFLAIARRRIIACGSDIMASRGTAELFGFNGSILQIRLDAGGG